MRDDHIDKYHLLRWQTWEKQSWPGEVSDDDDDDDDDADDADDDANDDDDADAADDDDDDDGPGWRVLHHDSPRPIRADVPNLL